VVSSAPSPPTVLCAFGWDILRCSRYACYCKGLRQLVLRSARSPRRIARSGRDQWQRLICMGRLKRARVHIGDWYQMKRVQPHAQNNAARGWKLCSAPFARESRGCGSLSRCLTPRSTATQQSLRYAPPVTYINVLHSRSAYWRQGVIVESRIG
jgi:hypothetical protein